MWHLNFSHFAPLFLVIAANSIYHVTSKNTASDTNPFLGLIATYSIALILSIALFLMTKTNNISYEISKIKATNFWLGLAVLSVESGWIMMYRKGWEINKASIIAICLIDLNYEPFADGRQILYNQCINWNSKR